jgi:hypothetical protein
MVFSGNYPYQERPAWIDHPLSLREAADTSNVSPWYFDVGQSHMAASESLARRRAREEVQRAIAANIATQICGYMEEISGSLSRTSDIEDLDTLIVDGLVRTIRTRVPSFEPIQWHIERGVQDGRNFFIASVGVRVPRGNIITFVYYRTLELQIM